MSNKRTIFRLLKILLVVFSISIIGILSIPVAARDNATPETVILREGNDFATIELRDPWDMDSFTDVSLGFNSTGAEHNLQNFQVSNGVFSARSSSQFPTFYALYPGYLPGMRSGKIGYLHPIDTSKFHCISLAMYVDPSPLTYHSIAWIRDDANQSQGGFTFGMKTTSGIWKLYSYDLTTYLHQSLSRWNTDDWIGLRVKSTEQLNKNFEIDWIRLTDCTAVNHTLTNLPADSNSIWIDTGSHEIFVTGGLSQEIMNGQYTLDVQGFQAGTYTINVKNASGNTVQRTSLLIEPAPIPTFVNPSPIIGDDYATLAGNPWDMRDNQDVIAVDCTSYAILNDILYVDTLPISSQPSRCIGSGANEADPKIYLNTPIANNITKYRYLSFRQKIDGPWTQPAQGMIVRWIWEMSGLAPKACKYVSREVALDVGWHIYWVDLYDLWNGRPAEVGGLNASSCPFPIQWKTTPGSLSQFRLDPNENILSSTMHQEFDWIRLTKVPTVVKGAPFTIQVSMNKPAHAIQSIKFYYTTDTNQPTQNTAIGSPVVVNQVHDNVVTLVTETSTQIFIPVVLNKYTPPVELPQVENEVRFSWNTDSVAPGEYYICAVTSDGYNQTAFCSQAPVQVLP